MNGANSFHALTRTLSLRLGIFTRSGRGSVRTRLREWRSRTITTQYTENLLSLSEEHRIITGSMLLSSRLVVGYRYSTLLPLTPADLIVFSWSQPTGYVSILRITPCRSLNN